jgi:hypothetical protein
VKQIIGAAQHHLAPAVSREKMWNVTKRGNIALWNGGMDEGWTDRREGVEVEVRWGKKQRKAA